MRIFVDSNVFIEYSKGDHKAAELLERVIGEELYINGVVYSEVAYIFIRAASGRNYFQLKKDKKLISNFGSRFIELLFPVLRLAEFLKINENIISMANDFIVEYGLLPNDALILATCKYYRIDALLTLDEEDFREACGKEGIHLICR
ncbi:MAG: VapC toxin family PIN domain ribonuclease [Methanobacteriota archaeon]|nr:MAG: VapC toxin family PIN domain ribonuclease [Euryarchaeota archaeon]